ncbi:MAG: peptide-methionine (S)-S-oxide reductase MsrA, partial [Eubacterium sp.]
MLNKENLKEIYLAGGCFWGVEGFIKKLPGVVDTDVGYANGHTENPSYEEVCRNNTGHAETVRVYYDPSILSLDKLIEGFFTVVDPTSKNRQGNDRGSQYRSGIYYTDQSDIGIIQDAVNEEQKKHIKKIVTEILPLECY